MENIFVVNDLIDNMNIDKLLETYSPLESNGQLKPGYNIQVGSCNGSVVNWSTHKNRNDNGTLIIHYERYKRFFGKLPKSTTADSGYGNQENYEYLKENHIENYIKYPLFHKADKKIQINEI